MTWSRPTASLFVLFVVISFSERHSYLTPECACRASQVGGSVPHFLSACPLQTLLVDHSIPSPEPGDSFRIFPVIDCFTDG